MIACGYLDSADGALSRTDHFGGVERARLNVAEAQVMAIEAVAAAVDRLAAAVEALQNQ